MPAIGSEQLKKQNYSGWGECLNDYIAPKIIDPTGHEKMSLKLLSPHHTGRMPVELHHC